MYDLAHADSRAAFDELGRAFDQQIEKWTPLIAIPLFLPMCAALFVGGAHWLGEAAMESSMRLSWLPCIGLYFAIHHGLRLLWRRREPARLTLWMSDIEQLEALVTDGGTDRGGSTSRCSGTRSGSAAA